MYKIASRYFLYSLAFLVAKRLVVEDKKKKAPEVPSFRGVVEVVHNLEGRIRLRIPSLKGDEQGFRDLKLQLDKIKSIKNVETNYITGTILIVFTDEIESTLLIGILIKLLGLEERVQRGNQSLVTKEFRSIEESLSLAVDEKTRGILDLRSLMFIALSAVGIRKMIKYPELTPPGFNYLWWAYTVINL